MTDLDKLDAARIVKTDGCWLWQGHLKWGYGSMRFQGRQQGVHRIAWQLAYGPIPEGLWAALHREAGAS